MTRKLPSFWFVFSVIVVIVLAIMPLFLANEGRRVNTWLQLMILMITAAGLGSAWNILGGYAGQLSLGHVFFYGIGAYSAAIFSHNYGLPSWIGLIVGPALAMLGALLVGRLTFRLKGPYFVLATIAIAEILQLLVRSLVDFTGGSVGLQITQEQKFWLGLPASIIGPPPGRIPFYWIALGITAMIIFVSWRISQSKMGYYLRAIREDQDTAETIGIDTTRYKLYALLISAGFVAMIGAFSAIFSSTVTPESALLRSTSLEIALYAIIGGSGSVIGPVIGGVLLKSSTDLFIGWFGQANQLAYGVMLVLVIFFLPGGLIGALRGLWERIAERMRTSKEG
jgi:branched-chain amino acid transport system permease protein